MPNPTATFKALADPTRQQILHLLARTPRTIAEVAENFDMTRAGVKKHLSILEKGRLIRVEPRGREKLNLLDPEGFQAARDWVATFDAFWDDRIAALTKAIEQENDQ